ncbi:MAG: type II toxin-antitoxin system HicB family antitoxin [Prevotellaceae bacterium]|jgi:predicted RNase H-like HicB family nuclease|nr:type II toxin-antitoxin system HicB family antitoxin [Prevotellaceae bacterium]
MKLKAIVELWDNGTYSIYVTNTKKHNISAQGKSTEEAKANLMDAINDYAAMYKETGKTVPKEIDSPEFEYRYDMASFFNYFNWINVGNLAKKAGINASLLRQYKSNLSFASEKQTKKIQECINFLGNELAAVRL